MVVAVDADVAVATLDQVGAQILRLDVRMDFVFAVGGLLALVEPGDLGGLVRDIEIAIFVAVVDAAIAAVDLRTFRYVDMQQFVSVQFDVVDGEVSWRRQLLGVVDRGDEVLACLGKSCGINAGYRAVVLYAKQQRAAMPVQKGAYRFVYVPIEPAAAGLESMSSPSPLASSALVWRSLLDIGLRHLQNDPHLGRVIAFGRFVGIFFEARFHLGRCGRAIGNLQRLMQVACLDGHLDQAGEHFLERVDEVVVQRLRQLLGLDEAINRLSGVGFQQVHVAACNGIFQVAEQ